MSDKFQIGLRTFCDDSTNDIHEYDTTVQTGICDQKDIDAFKKQSDAFKEQSHTVIELLPSDDENHSNEDTSPSSAVKHASSVDTSLLKGTNPSF